MSRIVETMRWFGPKDPVTLADIRQAGATGIVTALHEIENGAIWSRKAIRERKELIQHAGLEWVVVESVPVHEDIKKRSGNYALLIENYKSTIKNLAAEGIYIICYNFMPILDWTRTNLKYGLPSGARALKFDMVEFATFDCFILQRSDAVSDYSDELLKKAKAFYKTMNATSIQELSTSILAGLPGAEEGYTLEQFREVLSSYKEINSKLLSENLSYFHSLILPTAEKHKVFLAIHPDDPPFPIFGIPRIVSNAEDLRRIFKENNSPYNGITFCTGSFASRADNKLPEMMKEFEARIHFVHLRNVKRQQGGTFVETEHLKGDVPMYEVVQALHAMAENKDNAFPFRPDHGHQILDDLGKHTNPGYTAIGRLKGLAEIRGLLHGIGKHRSATGSI